MLALDAKISKKNAAMYLCFHGFTLIRFSRLFCIQTVIFEKLREEYNAAIIM